MNEPERLEGLDELERGYYVYVHKDKATGVPFYVGKGKGSRATSTKRGPGWDEKVASLPDGYEVEKVAEDLAESDAYELERELIAKYGKISEGTGTLVNWTDGGFVGGGEAGVEIGFRVPDEIAKRWKEQYENTPCRQLTKTEREELARDIQKRVDPLHERYMSLEDADYDEECEEDEIDYGTDFQSFLECSLNEVTEGAWELERRKTTVRDFAFVIEEAYDLLKDELDDIDVEAELDWVLDIARTLVPILKEKVEYLRNP